MTMNATKTVIMPIRVNKRLVGLRNVFFFVLIVAEYEMQATCYIREIPKDRFRLLPVSLVNDYALPSHATWQPRMAVLVTGAAEEVRQRGSTRKAAALRSANSPDPAVGARRSWFSRGVTADAADSRRNQKDTTCSQTLAKSYQNGIRRVSKGATLYGQVQMLMSAQNSGCLSKFHQQYHLTIIPKSFSYECGQICYNIKTLLILIQRAYTRHRVFQGVVRICGYRFFLLLRMVGLKRELYKTEFRL